MILTYVPPDDLGSVWEWVRAGLDDARAKAPNREHLYWRNEDVYHELTHEGAALWKIDDVGFLILQKNFTRYETVMFVWVIWAEPYSLLKAHKELMAELKKLARAGGVDRIRHISGNDWDVLGMFKPVATIYECGVNDD